MQFMQGTPDAAAHRAGKSTETIRFHRQRAVG